MTQFHEGQEVEVRSSHKARQANWLWRKAQIVGGPWLDTPRSPHYRVQLPDGTRAVVDAEQIRSFENN